MAARPAGSSLRGMKTFIALVAGLLIGHAAHAEAMRTEPYDSGWAFYADNDVFAPSRTDRDYTGGFSLTLAGRRVVEEWWSTDALRAGTDRLLGLDSLYADSQLSRHSVEVGVT